MAIVILNGRPHDLAYEPSVQHGAKPTWRTPTEINGRMVHGVTINGYDYPPADPNCVLYLPGLPGYGSTVWNKTSQGATNDGAITGATWVRLPSGLWVLSFDGTDDVVSCGNDSSLNLTTGWTALMWALNTTVDGNDRGQFFKTGAYGLEWYSGVAYGYVYGTGGGAIGRSGAPAVWQNTWVFYAITYDGGTLSSGFKMYGNGIQFDSANNEFGVFTAAATSANNLKFGDWDAQANFAGKIAMPQMVSGVMATTQIANIYQQERHLFGV